MNIAVTCYESLGVPGGSSIQVLRFAEALCNSGHAVTIYAPAITLAPVNPARVVYFPVINVPGLRFISYLAVAVPFLAFKFFSNKPDALLAFEVYFDCSSVLLSRLAKIPLHVFVNAIADQELALTGLRLPLKWALHSVQSLLVRSASRVYTISEEISSWLRRRYAMPDNSVLIIKNGVDTRSFSPREALTARTELGLPAEAGCVGFVGRAAPWHGLEYLADAAPAVLKAVPGTKFLIVGDGPALPAVRERVLEKGLAGDFIFTGAVPYHSVPLYINACDVCVVFYKPVRSYPGDPMKLYEYLSCGKPVVAGNVPGYGDFVERIGAGVSVDAADPAALAGAIAGLLKDERARAEMGRKGAEEMRLTHTWELRTAPLEAALRETLQ